MKNIIATILLSLSLLVPYSATTYSGQTAYRITDDFGGSINNYIKKYRMIAQSGGKVELDGFCISACTLILGILPREDVCVSEYSTFGFHSATDGYGDFHSEGTRIAWTLYPEAVKEKLRKAGWDAEDPEKAEHPALIYFEGSDFYEYCDPKDQLDEDFDTMIDALEKFGKETS